MAVLTLDYHSAAAFKREAGIHRGDVRERLQLFDVLGDRRVGHDNVPMAGRARWHKMNPAAEHEGGDRH